MKKVLIIGDGCKDVFRYGKCERLSPEAPVPVFKPIKANENGGMAVNVYNNLLALGVACDIITNSGITKTRYVDEVSNQMLIRIDEHDQIFLSPRMDDKIMNLDYNAYQAIVISDYNKGFLSEKHIQHISQKHPLTFLDTKKQLGSWCKNIQCIKINESEYLRNHKWLDANYHGVLIVTMGSEGAVLHPTSEHFPIENEHEVRDLSGAGDTFLAGLVADYIKNNDIRRAIKFANKCAAWTVTQKGVVVVNPEQL